MAGIKVSGRSKGKIRRIYGTRNLMQSAPKNISNSENEKEIFYKKLIGYGKNNRQGSDYNKKVKELNKCVYTISTSSIVKVLRAYGKTLSGARTKAERKQRIKSNLLINLKSEKVHHSVVKNIIKYEKVKLSKIPQKNSLNKPMKQLNIEPRKKEVLTSARDNSKRDAYKTIHNYLIIDPERKISETMIKFWTNRISTIDRLDNLQRVYQLILSHPGEDFEAGIRKYSMNLNKEEKFYIIPLWNGREEIILKKR